MTLEKLHAWWAQKQGLDGSLIGMKPAEVLAKAGWARSVGGSGPYLTFFARAGTSKAEAEKAVANLEIHELPSARGCTYYMPAEDYALALKVSQAFAGGEMKVASKLGVTEKEIEKLCGKVVDAVGKSALDPDEIKEVVGAAARHLGEEGKKKGLANTLPVALGLLQSRGEIRRVPVNGRLDQQRFKYIGWSPSPLVKFKLAPEEANIELARRYFRWIGPATLTEFQWFTSLSGKAAKAAIEPLGLTPCESGSDRLLHADEVEKFRSFKAPKKANVVLVSLLDSMVLLRRDFLSLLAPGDEKTKVVAEKKAIVLGGLADLPSHAIFHGGRLIGLWEFDPSASKIAYTLFRPADRAVEKAIRDTEAFASELGDIRSFSLDSPKSRVPRIEALRNQS